MTLQTARDYLADNELAIRGARGKLSNNAKLFLAKAIASGVKFSDWDENGKIKLEPVRVRKNAVKNSAPQPTIEEDSLPEQVAEVWVKPKPKPHAIVPPVREQNAISIIDDRGVNIVMSNCRNGHSISRCTCSTPKPAAFLNAVSYELVISEYA